MLKVHLTTQKKFACLLKLKIEYLVNNLLLNNHLFNLKKISKIQNQDNKQRISNFNLYYLKTFLKKLSFKQRILFRIMIFKLKVLLNNRI